MSTFDEAHSRYRAQYGIDRPPGRADWTPTRDYGLEYNLEQFLTGTGMPREKISEYTWPLRGAVPAATIWETVLPALRQLQSDMIGHFLYYLICVPQPLQVGFVRSFVTLVRAHQIMFILHARGETNGELLASWMADIYYSPYSIINPPKPGGSAQSVSASTGPSQNSVSTASTSVPTPDASLELETGNTSRSRRLTVDRIDLTESDVIDLTEEPEPEPGMATPGELSDLSFNIDSPIPGSPVRRVVVSEADPVDTADSADPVDVDSADPVSSPQPASIASTTTPSEESYRNERASKEPAPVLNFPRTGLPWELENFMAKVASLIRNPAKESLRENTMENMVKNLAVKYPPYTNSWPADMLPDEESFSSTHEAVHYAMLHAYPRFYQLVPRRDEENFMLHCNRMSADEVDTRKVTTRHSCKFALRVEHDKTDDKWVLKHVEGCSQHNHAPNTHLGVFEENLPFEPVVLDPTRFDFKGIVNLGKLMDAYKAGYKPTYGDYGLPFHFQGSPEEGIEELLKSPHVRHARDANGNLFLAHTQGYRWWRAYPEVVLVDDTDVHMVDETHPHRTVVIRGVDCHDKSFPIAACICPLNSKRADISSSTWAWIYNQLKELLQDYKVAFPGFFQATGTFEGLDRAAEAFPDAHVHLDPECIAAWTKKTASSFFKPLSKAKKLLVTWKKAIDNFDEDGVKDKLADLKRKGSAEDKKFLRAMEKQLKRTAWCYKNQRLHFNVDSCSKLKEPWGEADASPDHVFPMVESLLKSFAKSYEDRSKEHAEALVTTPTNYINHPLFDKVLHTISFRALEMVACLDRSLAHRTLSNCVCPWPVSSGHICEHELLEIKKTRNLCPTDFHPRWRNIQADLSPVDLSGQGRFAREWAAVKTGPQVYFPELSETEHTPSKRRRVG